MTINITAYQTTACAGYNLEKIQAALKATHIEGSLTPLVTNIHSNDAVANILSLTGGSAQSNNVPAFSHPLLAKLNDVNYIVIDSRSFGAYDQARGEFRVRNGIDYDLAVYRAKLNYIWADTPVYLRNVSQAPMALYAAWISEAVGRRFALDPREQFNLAILAALFYSSQFSDDVELDEQEKIKLASTISRNIRASAEDVLAVLDKVSAVNNVYEFCSRAEEITGSIRLKELNPGVLFSILGGTWYGTNSKELIAVAVEHPPTWLALLLYAFNERTFKNSQLAKLAERSTFKRIGEDYVKAVLSLLRVSFDEK